MRPRPRLRSTREIGRFVALAIGGFALVNVAGELLRPPFDTLGEWVLVPLPAAMRGAIEAAAAVALLAHGSGALPPRWRRLTAGLLGALALAALANAATFWAGLARGAFQTPAVAPCSLLVAGVLAGIAAQIATDTGPTPRWTARRALAAGGVAVAALVALPLLRIATFGVTRYERRADCAVVFGARVYADGTPSLALSDRVDEAIRLYQRGLVGTLVMSGAVDGENGRSEPEAMRARAVAAGVPESAIVLDEGGVDTASTVRNAAALMRARRMRSAIAVTHYYHEPRVKMLFDRAGVRAVTVPARMTRRLVKEPWFVLREVAAFYDALLLRGRPTTPRG